MPKPFDPGEILVVGVDTMPGANLALAWMRDAEVLGLGHDLSSRQVAARIIAVRPSHVVYCGPMAASRWDLDVADEDVAELPAFCAALVAAARKAGAHLTVLSTDSVFAAPGMFHPEDRPAAAPTLRARAIRQLEASLVAEALVVRTCVYGWAPPGAAPSFAERTYGLLRDGLTCVANADSYATPLLATDLAAPLLEAMRRGLTGIHHVAGAERISRREFAVSLARLAELPHDDDAIPAHDLAAAIPASNTAAGESSLDSRRLAELLHWTPPMVADGLARFLKQRDEGWPARLCDFALACLRDSAPAPISRAATSATTRAA